MTRRERVAKAWSDAKIARQAAPKGYRLKAQARLELAAVEALKMDTRKR